MSLDLYAEVERGKHLDKLLEEFNKEDKEELSYLLERIDEWRKTNKKDISFLDFIELNLDGLGF